MPTEPQAIVVTGVAGSGKTTVSRALAHHYGYTFVDADDFHAPDARAQMAAGVPLRDAQRTPWVDRLAHELRRLARQGDSSVLAFSGLRAEHRQRLRDCGVPMRFVHLHAAPSVIEARLAGRGDHFMPMNLLASQFEALQSPNAEPDAVVVDVDASHSQVIDRVIAALETPGAS